MKKVIVRKEILREYSSINVNEMDQWNYDSKVADEINSISQEEILAKYYKESDFEKLYSYYNKIKDTGKNNDYFACAYELSDDCIVQIDDEGHINIYRKDTRIVKDKIEWVYVVSKMYIGDAWWSDDSKIVSDIQNISFLEFLKKYKLF